MMDKKFSENEVDRSLEWKYHTPFFVSLNNKLDEIVQLGEQVYLNTKYLNLYFGKIKLLYSKYFPYIKDTHEIKRKLKEIGSILFSQEYINDLQNKKNMGYVNKIQYKCIEELGELFILMIDDFAVASLIPDVKIKEKVIGAVRIEQMRN